MEYDKSFGELLIEGVQQAVAHRRGEVRARTRIQHSSDQGGATMLCCQTGRWRFCPRCGKPLDRKEDRLAAKRAQAQAALLVEVRSEAAQAREAVRLRDTGNGPKEIAAGLGVSTRKLRGILALGDSLNKEPGPFWYDQEG